MYFSANMSTEDAQNFLPTFIINDYASISEIKITSDGYHESNNDSKHTITITPLKDCEESPQNVIYFFAQMSTTNAQKFLAEFIRSDDTNISEIKITSDGSKDNNSYSKHTITITPLKDCEESPQDFEHLLSASFKVGKWALSGWGEKFLEGYEKATAEVKNF